MPRCSLISSKRRHIRRFDRTGRDVRHDDSLLDNNVFIRSRRTEIRERRYNTLKIKKSDYRRKWSSGTIFTGFALSQCLKVNAPGRHLILAAY